MGAHRATSRWLALLRRHLLWVATATAVLLVTAAVTFASRPGAQAPGRSASDADTATATGPQGSGAPDLTGGGAAAIRALASTIGMG